MKITDEMLYTAIKKAVENGTIPKYSEINKYMDRIKEILEAAFEGKEE